MILLYDKYRHNNLVTKFGIFVSYGTCPLQHSTSDAAREPSACVIRRGLSAVALCHVSQYVCVFTSVHMFQHLITPYWPSCWASNDMEQVFFIPSPETDIHFHSWSRNSPPYHASDVRSVITLLSVPATRPCSYPDAHSPHPHILFILALSLLLTSYVRSGLPHRFRHLFGLIWLKLTPYGVAIAVIIACLNSTHRAPCP